jgi:hypothetical protein
MFHLKKTHRRISLIALFVMAFFYNQAQNLVPNYSFEDTIKCPTTGGFSGNVGSWSGAAPEYFNKLCTEDGILTDVPLNTFGYQEPHTGNAYAGIYTFIDSTYDPSDAGIRDYLEVKLTSSLIVSTRYYVTFYLSLADSFKYACNSIAAYFSDSALVWTGYAKSNLTPQVQNDTSHHLTDKVNWMKVMGNFIAKGGEEYLIIGNFKNDRHSDTIFVNSIAHNENLWTEAYYYIDDVIVSPDSNYADSLATVGMGELKNENENVEIFPNPNNGKFNIAVQNVNQKTEIGVYNMLGEKTYSNSLPQTSKGGIGTIDLRNQPAGIYFYRITSEKGELIGSGKLVIE